MFIEFLQPHTHAGVDYAPGTQLDCRSVAMKAWQVKWLLDQKAAKEIKSMAMAPTQPTPNQEA